MNCTVRVTPTTETLPSVTLTCMPSLWPLPPVAQPVHKATLNHATAKSRFFIIMKSLFNSSIDPNPEGTHLGLNPPGHRTIEWRPTMGFLLLVSAAGRPICYSNQQDTNVFESRALACQGETARRRLV